jgi:transcription termination factor Rho
MLVDGFLPLTKGRRCLIVGAPKTGKTTLLKMFAKKLLEQKNVKVFGLLIDQSLETSIEFSRIFDERKLVYSTYEDDAESHLFIAEFILKRAKRYAENGKDVVLFIDGVLSLAKAYDELNYSNDKILSCGLTAKTIRYIKKYLGSARAFENGGSLTVVCSLPSSTGNPEDDLVVSELSPVFNAKISLSEELAVKRIFPAIDLSASYVDGYDSLMEEKYREAYLFIRNYFLPKFGNEQLYRIAQNSADFDEFFNTIKSFVANS